MVVINHNGLNIVFFINEVGTSKLYLARSGSTVNVAGAGMDFTGFEGADTTRFHDSLLFAGSTKQQVDIDEANPETVLDNWIQPLFSESRMGNYRIWGADTGTDRTWGAENDWSAWATLRARMVALSDRNWYVGVELLDFDLEQYAISKCLGGVYFRWEQTLDELQIWINGTVEHWLTIRTAIATQADLKSALEAMYPYGGFNFAINTTTGDICVVYTGTGTTTFNYSVDLEEQINLGDSASAFVVSRWPVDRENWLQGRVQGTNR